MRYLGMSLGMAIALGCSAAFGTLLPPIVSGEIVAFASTNSGIATLVGVAICMGGIVMVGVAGRRREQESKAGRAAVPEFALRKGLAVAVFSGIMSSCLAYGLEAGDPIRALSLEAGSDPMMQSLPVLVVVLLGGFTTSVIWIGDPDRAQPVGGAVFGAASPAPEGALTGPRGRRWCGTMRCARRRG